MKTIGKRLTFLILIMCVAVSISAQSYQLSGCVQDENNQPVEVANILLKQAKDSTYLTGMLTDAQGCFTFTQPKGEYLLHITLIGCEDIYLPVSLQGNKNVGMLTLKSSSTFLNEVTVTAARPVIKRLVDRVVFDTHNAIATAGVPWRAFRPLRAFPPRPSPSSPWGCGWSFWRPSPLFPPFWPWERSF